MFRILIAEDDPSTARLLCAIVKRAGYEPLIAADGVQALEMLDHNHIDLLLCDVMMPRMDGFTLTLSLIHISEPTRLVGSEMCIRDRMII